MSFPKYFQDPKTVHKSVYGPNIVFSEHNDWRKHRRIAGPSFSESNNALVWESTIKIILGYFIKWNQDGKGDIIKVSDFTEVSKQIAFMVFSIAGAYATRLLSSLTQVTSGFGIDVDWDCDKNEIPKGHTMSFMRALAAAAEGLLVLLVFPRWLLLFNKRGREVVRGHDEMEVSHLAILNQWPNLKL